MSNLIKDIANCERPYEKAILNGIETLTDAELLAVILRTGTNHESSIDLANKIAGWAAGGPAKVAVISSALCGMVSGSSVGNTVTTGSVTIPMMKDTG